MLNVRYGMLKAEKRNSGWILLTSLKKETLTSRDPAQWEEQETHVLIQRMLNAKAGYRECLLGYSCIKEGEEDMRATGVTGSPDVTRRGVFARLVMTGEAEITDAGWAVNRVPGWSQREWISPALVADFIGQGLAEQVDNKLMLTEVGRKGIYTESHSVKHYVRTVSSGADDVLPKEDDEGGTEKVRKPRTRVVAAGKLTDNSRIKLLKQFNARGGEKLFLEVWKGLPESTGSIVTLTDAFTAAGAANQNDPLKSTRYYVKAAFKRGDCEIAE